MTLAAVAEIERPQREAFRARAILVLVLVGVTAFAGFAVLATYAPELRGRTNGGAHALSSSAVGYRGATIMLKALGTPVTVSRARPRAGQFSGIGGLVLTPQPGASAAQLRQFPSSVKTLIVLPKWAATPDPARPGFVRKAGFLARTAWAAELLSTYEANTTVTVVAGFQRPVLRGVTGESARVTRLPLGRLDGLQTIGGPGWSPELVDEQGHVVLAISNSHPNVAVLADPDLLNNQGITDIDTARGGMAILKLLSQGQGVMFDVTLNGLGRGRSLARLALEPPWLAATLCVLAAALLTGWQALARFGAPAQPGRAIALGAAALVDNSAGLVRMARKEPALAPAYAETTLDIVARAAGADASALGGEAAAERLARAAERRGLEDPNRLSADAVRVRTRDELMVLARKLYDWRREMTREGE